MVVLLLSKYEARREIVGGVMKIVKAHTPNKMRLIYHLPERGAWAHLLWAYVRWFFVRTWRARVWMRRNSILREYTHAVEMVESARESE